MHTLNKIFERLTQSPLILRLLSSFAISNTGDWLDIFALQAIFAYHWHVSPLLLSALVIIYFGPSILFSQIAGVVADRVNKLYLMISADVICCALTVAIILSDNPFLALVFVALRSVIANFNSPAQQALLKQITKKENLLQVTSLYSTMSQLAKIAGPLIGAVVVAYSSPYVCLWMNAVSFIIAAFLLIKEDFWQAARAVVTSTKKNNSYFSAWFEGWSVVFKNKTIFFGAITFFTIMFLLIGAEAQMSIFSRHIASKTPELLGRIIGISGIGSLLMSMALSMKKELKGYVGLLSGGAFLMGVGYFGMGFYQLEWTRVGLYFFAFVQGAGMGAAVIGYTYLIRMETPQQFMGRISGISSSLQGVAMVIGPLLSGFAALVFGVAAVFQIVGVCFIVLTAIIFFLKVF